MANYIVRRLLLIIPVFVGVTFITFALARLIPGDPFASETLPPATRNAIRESYGLNRPIYEQYAIYLFNFLRGDWGPSFQRGGTTPVTQILFGNLFDSGSAGLPFWLQTLLVIAVALTLVAFYSLYRVRFNRAEWGASFRPKLGPTLLLSLLGWLVWVIFTLDASSTGGFIFSARLGLMAFGFMIIVGIPLGILAALSQNTWIDYTVTTIALIGFSIPSFVLGLLALIAIVLTNLTLGTQLSVAPTSPGVLDLLLPAVLLGLREASIIARLTRSSMLEVLRQDYIRTAQSKGLPARPIIVRHALKNAFIPILTVLGDSLAGLLTGSVTLERIFNIPGIGNYFVSSILVYDYPMILGTVVLYSLLVVTVNLAVDILYSAFDPRISYS